MAYTNLTVVYSKGSLFCIKCCSIIIYTGLCSCYKMEAVEKDDQLLRHLLRITKNHGNIIKGKSTKQLKKIIKTYLMAV